MEAQQQQNHATASPSTETDRMAARTRSKKKQMKFQRHKARNSSPKISVAPTVLSAEPEQATSTSASPPRADTSSAVVEESSVPALSSSPPRRSAMSSPYIQGKLATPTRKNIANEEEISSQVPRRQQPTTASPNRKSDLIKQMRAKKQAVVAARPKYEFRKAGSQIISIDDLQEVSKERTTTVVDGEVEEAVVSSDVSVGSALMEPALEVPVNSEEKPKPLLDVPEPSLNTPFNENAFEAVMAPTSVMEQYESEEEHDDPPFEEVHSEVSVGQVTSPELSTVSVVEIENPASEDEHGDLPLEKVKSQVSLEQQKSFEPGTASTVERDYPIDETMSDQDPPLQLELSVDENAPQVLVEESVEVEEVSDTINAEYASQLHAFVEQSKQQELSFHEDPPLVEMQSEVSMPNSAFDMRSIHEHPPSPPSPPSEKEEGIVGAGDVDRNKDQDNGNDNASASDISVNFTPLDDEFVHHLVDVEVEQEEEKKDKEDNESDPHNMDTTWDVTNPVFEQTFAPTGKAVAEVVGNNDPVTNDIDVFDTSSWAHTDAGFSDIDSHFVRLMEEGPDNFSTDMPVDQKQVLEDVKRNLELAGSIVRENSMIKEGSLSKLDPLPQIPEPIKEDEPLLIERAQSSDETDKDEEDQMRKEERVEMYNAPQAADGESSAGDDDTEATDELEVFGYVSQNSDDDTARSGGETEVYHPEMPYYDRQEMAIGTEGIPTFDAAAAAAKISDSPSMVEVEGLSVVDGTNSKDAEPLNGSVSSSIFVVGETRVAGSINIGLSSGPDTSEYDPTKYAGMPPPPPPPGKKHKKKRRNVAKSASAVNVPLLAPPPEEKVKKWEDEKMRGQRHIAAMKAKREEPAASDIEGPPEVMRTSEPSLFSTPSKSKPAKSPSEKARSPSNVESVLSDKKLADKAAAASSAAAMTFEEHLEKNGSHPIPPSAEVEKPSSRNPIASGAFANWTTSDFSKVPRSVNKPSKPPAPERGKNQSDCRVVETPSDKELLAWFTKIVLRNEEVETEEQNNIPLVLQLLLEHDENFNIMCEYMADCVNAATTELGTASSLTDLTLTTNATAESLGTVDSTVDGKMTDYSERKRTWLKPMILSKDSRKLAPGLLAANFVSLLYLASKLTKVQSPFRGSNPFLSEIVNFSLIKGGSPSRDPAGGKSSPSPQQLIFNHPEGQADMVVGFIYKVCVTSEYQSGKEPTLAPKIPPLFVIDDDQSRVPLEPPTPSTGNISKQRCRRFIVPDENPSPFETAVWAAPRIVPAVLSFLGDPVAVCRVKMVNRFCRRIVSENEHMIMQDAVRVGGLSMNVRPAFWMWVALQKFQPDTDSRCQDVTNIDELKQLEKRGYEGPWHHVIQRDVTRSFGNMPPHKTGARLRTDSIVRALVTWGQNRIMRRGVKGGGEEMPLPELGSSKSRKPRRSTVSSPPWECAGATASVDSENSQTPTDTVSDWGGVSPVASYAESNTGNADMEGDISVGRHAVVVEEELALSGNCLTNETKTGLRGKLSFILHSLAASHGEVGYCQGMDYVVAHLLRILQDTIRWNAVQGTLPPCIKSAATLPDLFKMQEESLAKAYEVVDKSLVVEEAVFRVMDTFFTTYNLRHMYWPELRCLKTCCRVFERLIQIKLPVLADHFEHHDLNVGLFALGWFQTLFLYLPSMPSATVCHMWDIWLVERSFKIFFRVGTAILFLSQPILLNHELEGMMTYLNTIPDATLLKPDILIPCALNIKVTNSILQELEEEVTAADA